MKNFSTLKLSKYCLNYFLGTFFVATMATSASGQDIPLTRSYPQSDFRQPLDIQPVRLAGSFGEIRGGHFHSGSDYRTNQREGYPVYAVADGYVSRLRVQIGGFGNALYISHPNGYTTVYAHLKSFSPRIARIVKDYQYRKRSFDVDFPLMQLEIPVKKGEVIAQSGNTGSSGGPHLHFEVRDSKTEEIIDPQLFGLPIEDSIQPTLDGLYMYRLNDKPFSENTPRQFFDLRGAKGNYLVLGNPLIKVNGPTGFGIHAYDIQTAGNKNGIYSIELKIDTSVVFLSSIERFSFADTRSVNSHIDYPANLQFGRTIQKSFVEPGNTMSIYRKLVNRGIINLVDKAVHQMTYTVKDVSGNTSILKFRIQYDPTSVIRGKEIAGVKVFPYNQQNDFATADFRIMMPKGTLYDTINFRYDKTEKRSGSWSDTHFVHTRMIPVNSNYTIWIKADSSLPKTLHSKLVVVDNRGVALGASFENGFVKASPRAFGSFAVRVDTIAPHITPLNIGEGRDLSKASRISLRIADNLSGIKSFNSFIDNKWVLTEYDPRIRTVWHSFDGSFAPGTHNYELQVTDMVGNTRSYKATFKL